MEAENVRKTARFAKTARPARTAQTDNKSAIEVNVLRRRAQEYDYENEYRGLSLRTREESSSVVGKLIRYLDENGLTHCSNHDIRGYLIAVSKGEMQRGGRWGQQASPKPVRPRTVRNHWSYCRTLFNWMADEYPDQPRVFERIMPPIVRSDHVVSFNSDQVRALIQAARRSKNPLRDEAILLFMLDTGARASELCALTFGDLDLDAHGCAVLGKGNKRRLVFLGELAAKHCGRVFRTGILTMTSLSSCKCEENWRKSR